MIGIYLVTVVVEWLTARYFLTPHKVTIFSLKIKTNSRGPVFHTSDINEMSKVATKRASGTLHILIHFADLDNCRGCLLLDATVTIGERVRLQENTFCAGVKVGKPILMASSS